MFFMLPWRFAICRVNCLTWSFTSFTCHQQIWSKQTYHAKMFSGKWKLLGHYLVYPNMSRICMLMTTDMQSPRLKADYTHDWFCGMYNVALVVVVLLAMVLYGCHTMGERVGRDVWEGTVNHNTVYGHIFFFQVKLCILGISYVNNYI